MLVAWDDQRATFKFDAREVPPEGLQVADFFTSPAGTSTPLTLRAPARAWHFDFEGKFVKATP